MAFDHSRSIRYHAEFQKVSTVGGTCRRPIPTCILLATLVKYGMGVPILVIIVVLLWLPLLLFALVNSIGLRLPPVHATFSIIVEGYPVSAEFECASLAMFTVDLF